MPISHRVTMSAGLPPSPTWPNEIILWLKSFQGWNLFVASSMSEIFGQGSKLYCSCNGMELLKSICRYSHGEENLET